MRRDEHIDFFVVAEGHLAIHKLLEDWAVWVKPRPHGWHMQPMFRQYRSHAWQWEAPTVRTAPNVPQCIEMEKAVSLLPEKHRTAIRFAYVWCGSPIKVARELGVSKQGLMDLIHSGRTMLKNRSA